MPKKAKAMQIRAKIYTKEIKIHGYKRFQGSFYNGKSKARIYQTNKLQCAKKQEK